MLLLICGLLPVVLGGLLPSLRMKSRTVRMVYAMLSCCAVSGLLLYLIFTEQGGDALELIRFSDVFRFSLRLDGAGKVYLGVAAVLWPLSVLYAVEYMRHEEREGNFFAWFIVTYGAAILFGCADNLFTLYIGYEFLTLCTVPLVWHKRDEESNRAALKYMLYLIGGAALGFVAMAGLSGFGLGAFRPLSAVGSLDTPWFRVLCLVGFLGFGVKAAVLPLCHWLPTASVAPTPVTALLHAVAVVNAGVFAVMRFLYYVISPASLRGTWVQTVMLSLCAATIVFAAIMAVREQHVKRRLAWSTVSNLSYMLLGLCLLTGQGITAGLSHLVFHSLTKIILFFCAGAVLVQTGRTQVYQMHGLGRKMPVVFLSFLLAGVSLLGVPPLPGFVSKYALVTAAFAEGSVPALCGAVAILLAAVLTVIYIFTIAYPSFFMKLQLPQEEDEPRDPGACMKIVFVVLAVLQIGAGIFAGPVMQYLSNLAGGVIR
ncbi:MAG: proton-conducting membrane transporter [Clostridia bacterium]|nr:proton-conducting membrane transporter [Clostridia bacterium]